MEFQEVLNSRRSIRDFSDQSIPDDKLKIILESARIAQSGGNRQNWKFIVVRDSDKRQQLMQAANNQRHVGQAPVIIAAVALDPDRIMMCEVSSFAMDIGIAVENMTLAAADLGIGSCWIGAFSQAKAREVLGVPEKYKVAALLPIGYSRAKAGLRLRKSMEEVICYESFEE